MSYVIAAVRFYRAAVLESAQDDAAEATVGLGRRLLQRIFGTRKAGEPLPKPLADAAADPNDEDTVAALRLAIRKALSADPGLRADVEGMLARGGATVTAAGERSVAAQTITGIAATGDNAMIDPAGFSSPDALKEWLAKFPNQEPAYDQQRLSDLQLVKCAYCGRPLEGNSTCSYCGRDQYIAESRPPPSQPVVYDYLVRNAFAELDQPGRLMFNPPDRMQLNHTERVEVRLTRTVKLDTELLEHLRGHGEPQLEKIPTAPLMAVTLKGDGFRIMAFSDEEQSVTQDGITTWEFDITALKRGQQRLVMCVSLRIPVPGQPLEHKSIPVREATIDVQVGVPALVGHFVSGNWQWFVGTAIAIAAVVVAVLHH
jgi:hypothetical protein